MFPGFQVQWTDAWRALRDISGALIPFLTWCTGPSSRRTANPSCVLRLGLRALSLRSVFWSRFADLWRAHFWRPLADDEFTSQFEPHRLTNNQVFNFLLIKYSLVSLKWHVISREQLCCIRSSRWCQIVKPLHSQPPSPRLLHHHGE